MSTVYYVVLYIACVLTTNTPKQLDRRDLNSSSTTNYTCSVFYHHGLQGVTNHVPHCTMKQKNIPMHQTLQRATKNVTQQNMVKHKNV